MKIHEKILEVRDVRDKKAFIKHFIDHPKDFDAMLQLVLDEAEYPYKEYGSWILMHLSRSKQMDLQYLYPSLVDLLFKSKNQTVLRNIANSIVQLEVTEYRESEFIDLLIQFIQDANNKVALQVYAIYILIGFIKLYPELREEIMEIIDLHSVGKTAAYNVAQRNFILKTRQ